MDGWRDEVRKLYFEKHKTTKEIAIETSISRQTISEYLNTLPELLAEKERRKAINKSIRRENKKIQNQAYRAAHMEVTAESMRQEHDIAAMILSREMRY